MLPDLSEVVTAYHEAGHVVVALAHGGRCRNVTIVPSGRSAGHTALSGAIVGMLGGVAAEVILAGGVAPGLAEAMCWGGASDFAQAEQRVEEGLRQSGEEFSPATPGRVVSRMVDRAIRCLDDRWSVVHRLAGALIERRTLTEAEIAEVTGQVTQVSVDKPLTRTLPAAAPTDRNAA